MKEYIFQQNIEQDSNVIQILDAPIGLTKKNILAIINKTTKTIVHSPLIDSVNATSYAETTFAIILKAEHPSIAGDLLIKAYSDAIEDDYAKEDTLTGIKSDVADIKAAVENINMSSTEEHIMGGKLPYDCGESVPAFIGYGNLADTNDMNEDCELVAYSHIYFPRTLVVGDVFTAGSFQEQQEGMFFLAKSVNNPALHYDGQDFSISGITEKLEVLFGKSYIVTGIYELHYGDEDYGVEESGMLLTYAEYEQGRSVREVYKKIDGLKETIGNLTEATATEYAAFKSHMEAEIENILTPIEEEEE